MEERIKNIYNDCWKSYKEYLRDHDMYAYNNRSIMLTEKYGNGSDLVDLLLWFAPRVNMLHEEWRKQNAGN